MISKGNDMWKLTPRSKGKKVGSNANRNLNELANYFPDKTAEDLTKEVIETSVDVEAIIDRWDNLTYSNIFRIVKTMDNKDIILRKIINRWRNYNLKDLIAFIGKRETKPVIFLRAFFTYIRENYPFYYRNKLLKIWPRLRIFLK